MRDFPNCMFSHNENLCQFVEQSNFEDYRNLKITEAQPNAFNHPRRRCVSATDGNRQLEQSSQTERARNDCRAHKDVDKKNQPAELASRMGLTLKVVLATDVIETTGRDHAEDDQRKVREERHEKGGRK